MKNKKILIILLIVLIAVILVIGAFFITKTITKNKYKTADEYDVNGYKVTSVKAVLGEKNIIDYSKKSYENKGNKKTEELILEFEDSNKEESAEEYINYIKDSGNFIETGDTESGKREISSPEGDQMVLSIGTEITDNGFKVIITAGPATIQIDPQDE